MHRRCSAGAALCALALALVGCGSSPRQVLLQVDGSGNADSTGMFAPSGAWSLTYHWDCAQQQSKGLSSSTGFGLQIYNADDGTLDGESPGAPFDKAASGTGTLRAKQPGAYFVKVFSPCTWRVVAAATSA